MATFLRGMLLVLLLWPTSASAQGSSDYNQIVIEPFTSKELVRAIDSYGVRKILHYILGDNKRAKIAYEGIQSGDPEWLKLFPRLRGASDAMYTTMLDGSVVYALSRNPEGALEAMYGGNVSPENNCGKVWEDWEDSRDDRASLSQLAQTALNEINSRIKALQSIPDTNFEYIRSNCLKDLESNKAFWENSVNRR